MGYPESYYLKSYCKWFFGKCQCTTATLRHACRHKGSCRCEIRSGAASLPAGTPCGNRPRDNGGTCPSPPSPPTPAPHRSGGGCPPPSPCRALGGGAPPP